MKGTRRRAKAARRVDFPNLLETMEKRPRLLGGHPMKSPFPGIDPYLEDQGHWPDFHNTFLTSCRDALLDELPDHYDARIDERFRLFEVDSVRPRLIEPDVAITRRKGPSTSVAASGGPLLVEPVLVSIGTPEVVEERLTWVEVRRLPGRELVTVIELLSPSNKSGLGREDYLDKRWATLRQSVNLVELDFLIGGRRLPLGGPLPPGDFYAVVTRAGRRENCEVFAWNIDQPLPLVPVPLKAPDPDVPLDLHAIFRTTFDRGRYPRVVDYGAALGLPLPPEVRAWAELQARSIATG